jgi:hypothetical protein
MNNIVSVRYYKEDTEQYAGRAYSYFAEIPLVAGDEVLAPTGENGALRRAVVVDDNVPENKIDERILPLLKTITVRYTQEGA